MSRQGTKLVSLDIETTGLDPATSHVIAAALVGEDGPTVESSRDEPVVLRWLERTVSFLPEGDVLVTWNGEEFDLPFLARRYKMRGITTSLRIRPRAGHGKYGGQLFEASWAGHPHVDIAPHYQEEAERLGVTWNLKPVSRAILGVEPVEVDRRGVAIATLDEAELRRYVLSDAQITYALAKRLLPESAASSI